MRTCDRETAAALFTAPGWHKATASNANGTGCVEVNRATPGLIGLRDSKDPHGPALAFTPTEWRTFLHTLTTRTPH